MISLCEQATEQLETLPHEPPRAYTSPFLFECPLWRSGSPLSQMDRLVTPLAFVALFGALLSRMAYVEALCVAEPSPSANLTLLTGLPAFGA
jgi:hypothetical protein